MTWHIVTQDLPEPCYIQIRKGKCAKTIEYTNENGFPEALVDLDKDGMILGFELLAESVLTYDEEV